MRQIIQVKRRQCLWEDTCWPDKAGAEMACPALVFREVLVEDDSPYPKISEEEDDEQD